MAVTEIGRRFGFLAMARKSTKNIGEIGILTAVVLHDAAPDKLFLRIDIDHVRYMGCLAFTDAMFCRQLHDVLQDHLGKSIKEIGDLDFSRTL